MSTGQDSMRTRRIIGVAAFAEANSAPNNSVRRSAVSSVKSRDILSSHWLTARSMTAAPHGWLTKVARTKAQACRMPAGTQWNKSNLGQWQRRHLEGGT